MTVESLAVDPVSGAVPRIPPGPGVSAGRARLRAFFQRFLTWGSGLTAVIPFVALVSMVIILLFEAIPVFRVEGWSFFTSSVFQPGNLYAPVVQTNGVTHPQGASFGAYPLIIGTLESSAIALIVAVPIAVGAAIYLVEKAPRRIAAGIGLCIEILAGVPSAVIGLWGIFAFGPFLAQHVYPTLNKIPLGIFQGSFSSTGQGLLTGGLVLAAMIVPIICATTRDLLRQVPGTTTEGAVALGLTDAEVFRTVQARWVRTGVIGASVLGLGRALGETIAIALVGGGAIQLSGNIFGTMSTIAATIVLQLDGAQSDPTGYFTKALAALALVLMVITLITNVLARRIVRRAARGAALPLGAGL